jgi:hypothetical protein
MQWMLVEPTVRRDGCAWILCGHELLVMGRHMGLQMVYRVVLVLSWQVLLLL